LITGLETEYGIMMEDGPQLDPTAASQLFFNSWRPENLPGWDFATEQPSQDARGWLDLNTPLTPPEQSISDPVPSAQPGALGKSDLSPGITLLDRMNFNAMLANGARFYIDHAHPEYSTPECTSIRDLIAADVAGQWFLSDVARRISDRSASGHRFALYRNNTDFHGNSYGCHENYLMTAACYTALFGNRQHLLFTFLVPFLVTRQIFCGAGKVGAEDGTRVDYQISQRADFIETVVGLQTVWRRPIINTRDEPHADGAIYRRLHVTLGDSNMAEPSTYLKVGVTQLVLDMLEAGWSVANLALSDPVATIKAVSRDLTCKQPMVALEGHKECTSALDIQRRYLEQTRQFLDQVGATPHQDAVWTAWHDALEGLEKDTHSLDRKIDWLIKHSFLETQRTKRDLSWDNPVIKEMDVKYHGVIPDRSIYHLLLRNDLVDRVVTDEEVKERLASPPPDTRAALRTELMSALEPMLLAVNWDCVTVFDVKNTQLVRLRLPDPAGNGSQFREGLRTAADPLEVAAQYCLTERFALEKKKNEPRERTNISQPTG
jgi:proteasome accessory factor A